MQDLTYEPNIMYRSFQFYFYKLVTAFDKYTRKRYTCLFEG